MLGFLRRFGLIKSQYEAPSTDKIAAHETAPNLDHRIDQIILGWPSEMPFRVEQALQKHPEFRQEHRALIEFAIEEYRDREEDGEAVNAKDFVRLFPDIQSALLDSLAADVALRRMTGLLPLPTNDKNITWPKVGEVIGKLSLIEQLGKGGFSRVYLAEDFEHHGRRVAVKVCRSDTHEVQTLADLQHSAIGLVHYVRELEDPSLVAICMPMISRTTLDDVIQFAWKPLGIRVNRVFPRSSTTVWEQIRKQNQSGKLTPDWADQSFVDWTIAVGIQVARALVASHAKGIVHCDIKPSNLLITPEGQPVLVDFNIAFRQNANQSPANVGGTIPYMAPEQLRAFVGAGFTNIGPAADLFGFGATFYQLLTGLLPFGHVAKTDLAGLLNSRQIPPTSIKAENPMVDEELEELILQCLKHDPADRPKSAIELARRLERLQESRRAGRSAHHDRSIRLLGGLAIVAAAIVAAVAVQNVERPSEGGVQPPAQGELEPVLQASDFVEEAYALFEKRDLDAAIGMFEAALKIDDEHFGARLGLARTLGCAGQVKRAERELDRLDWQGAREPAEIRAFRCYCRLQSARLPDELNDINDMLTELRSEGVNGQAVVSNHATCMMKLQRPDDALRHANRAQHLDSNNQAAQVIGLIALINVRASQGQNLTPFEFEGLEPVLTADFTEPYFAWVVADCASGFATMNQGSNAVLADRLRQFAANQFQRAIQRDQSGEIRKAWPRIKDRFSGPTLSQLAPLVADIAADAQPVEPQKKPFLVDPLVASRFAHYVQRDLDLRGGVLVSMTR